MALVFSILAKSASAQFTLQNVGYFTNYSSGPANILISGRYGYMPCSFSGSGLRVYDLSNPTSPRMVAQTDPGGNGTSVAVFGNYAYLAETYHGLILYDISDPTSPVQLWVFSNSDLQITQARVVLVSGHYLYLGSNFSIKIYTLANPVSPGWPEGVGSIRLTNAIVKDLAVSGDYLYVASDSDGLHIYNISDPAHPSNIGYVGKGASNGYATVIVLSGRFAYLANYADGLRIYDVSDSTMPVNVGHVNHGGVAAGVAVSGVYAYVAYDTNGLYVYDVSDPANPVTICQAAASKAEGVVLSGPYTYLDNWNYSGNWEDVRIYSLVGPRLNIALTSTNSTLLSWPSSSPNFRLEWTSNLNAATTWDRVTNLPNVVAGTNQIIMPPSAGKQFYRLKYP